VVPIYDEIFAYADRWPDADALRDNPQQFVRETRRVMRRLAERVMLETSVLYPMVDDRA
jgi:hypothetical protein